MQLREAADTLGVHYQTAYGWVRQGSLPARKTGRGYELSDRDVRAFAAARSHAAPPPREIRIRDWAAQADQLYDALIEGDEQRAGHLVGRLATGVSMLDLCEKLIAPALRRVGEQWAAGRVSVAHEHRASAVCERLITLHSRQPPGRPRGCAITATPPGERHGLPALMAAACLREDHWQVQHLDADLPLSDVTELAAQTGARLLVLCTAIAESATRAEAARPAIAAACPDLIVLVGRPGASLQDLRSQARHLRPAGAGHPQTTDPASARE